MKTQTAPQAPERPADEMPLLGIDHVELYVGNASQAAYFFTHALGFRRTAYAGLESGTRDRASHVMEQGRVRFVLTTPLLGTGEIARHVAEHGDGVKVVALAVPDAEQAYRVAVRRGARGVREPWESSDDSGAVRMATIATYGETLHTFVERDGYEGAFLPGFNPVTEGSDTRLFTGIDHVVGNVELGRLDEWVSYYERVFGFTEMIHFTDRDISTEYSALMSKVMADGKGRIKFPINEPAEGKRKSQIEEYLEYYGGAGVQHIALATTDIVRTVSELQARGMKFLNTPTSYYEELPGRIGEIDEDLADLRRLGILADRDDEGYLLQIFTRTIGDRPTLFCEVIERHGARGFGEGNFKALFEAIEREQEKRGNL
ncbi:MAG: 4-hydroxyphenylpyruvate dioxygenase [Actinobacteria bacterium 13_1_20CM_3_68_9]|jgi:4-hydroxyphenylpyruvate dioxygenase|nr:MAG: 4-hydroxyphenylpyruvate dioxygenase [Actinobacteria bacterium 13_1_20CM_3_68_9]